MEKRKVVVYEWKKVKEKMPYEKVSSGNGIFLKFGVDYEELELGVGT